MEFEALNRIQSTIKSIKLADLYDLNIHSITDSEFTSGFIEYDKDILQTIHASIASDLIRLRYSYFDLLQRELTALHIKDEKQLERYCHKLLSFLGATYQTWRLPLQRIKWQFEPDIAQPDIITIPSTDANHELPHGYVNSFDEQIALFTEMYSPFIRLQHTDKETWSTEDIIALFLGMVQRLISLVQSYRIHPTPPLIPENALIVFLHFSGLVEAFKEILIKNGVTPTDVNVAKLTAVLVNKKSNSSKDEPWGSLKPLLSNVKKLADGNHQSFTNEHIEKALQNMDALGFSSDKINKLREKLH